MAWVTKEDSFIAGLIRRYTDLKTTLEGHLTVMADAELAEYSGRDSVVMGTRIFYVGGNYAQDYDDYRLAWMQQGDDISADCVETITNLQNIIAEIETAIAGLEPARYYTVWEED